MTPLTLRTTNAAFAAIPGSTSRIVCEALVHLRDRRAERRGRVLDSTVASAPLAL